MRLSDALKLLRWRPGGYIKSSSALFLWLSARTITQIVLVFELTHVLGASGYGSFVATLAIATLFTPLAGLGLYSVLVRDGSRTPNVLNLILGAMLKACLLACFFFGAIGSAIASWVLPSSQHTIGLVVLVWSEIISASLVELLARSQLALHNAQRYGILTAGLVVIRVLALNLYILAAHPTVTGWMLVYSFASLGYTIWIYVWTIFEIAPKFPKGFRWAYLREGAPFLIAILSLRVQAEVNKPVLARLGTTLAGNFNIAQRALDVVALPLSAMQEVLSPRLFAAGNPLQKALLPGTILVLLGFASAAGLWIVAPFVASILGPGFEAVTKLIRVLALLPTIQALRNLLGVLIVAIDKSDTLTFSYLLSMGAAIYFNVVLIPNHGLEGAVHAAYITELIGCTVLACILAHHLWKRRG